MHPAAYRYAATHIIPPLSTIELGSLDVNGNLRSLFTGKYVGVDLVAGPNVDLVADAASDELVERVGMVEQVVCCELLEHAEHAERIVANVGRMLESGGRFVMTCATDPREPHACDGGPDLRGEWYRNVDAGEFVAWCLRWGRVVDFEVSDCLGDLRAVVVKQ